MQAFENNNTNEQKFAVIEGGQSDKAAAKECRVKDGTYVLIADEVEPVTIGAYH